MIVLLRSVLAEMRELSALGVVGSVGTCGRTRRDPCGSFCSLASGYNSWQLDGFWKTRFEHKDGVRRPLGEYCISLRGSASFGVKSDELR